MPPLCKQVARLRAGFFLFLCCGVDVLRLFGFGCCVHLLGAGAGVCARRRTYFLFAQKESRQRNSAPQSASLRFAAGNLRCSGLGWRRGTRCVLRTPLKHPRRARSRSVCVLRHTRPPQLLRFSAQPEGVEAGSRTAAAAQLRLGSVRAARCRRAAQPPCPCQAQRRHPGPSEAMARMEPAPTPFWLRREAQGLGWVRVPKDTRTS